METNNSQVSHPLISQPGLPVGKIAAHNGLLDWLADSMSQLFKPRY